MLEYSLVGVILALISIVGFMYLYRETEETAFLYLGGIVYLKLLFSTFNLLNELVFIVPEFLVLIWLSTTYFNARLKVIIPLLIVLFIFYTICILNGLFSKLGLPGLCIMLIYLFFHKKKRIS